MHTNAVDVRVTMLPLGHSETSYVLVLDDMPVEAISSAAWRRMTSLKAVAAPAIFSIRRSISTVALELRCPSVLTSSATTAN
jgi:hypothetical protein